jgi:hypothetical protein
MRERLPRTGRKVTTETQRHRGKVPLSRVVFLGDECAAVPCRMKGDRGIGEIGR